jgi:UDP-galactopyranose mutase
MNREENIIFGGRLADCKYYNMHQVIASALHQVKFL